MKLSDFDSETRAIEWAGIHWGYATVLHWVSLGGPVTAAVLAACDVPLAWVTAGFSFGCAAHAGWEWESRRVLDIWRQLAERAEQEARKAIREIELERQKESA